MKYRKADGTTREMRPVRAWIRSVDWSGPIVLAVRIALVAAIAASMLAAIRNARTAATEPLEAEISALEAEHGALLDDYAVAVIARAELAAENRALESHTATLTSQVESLTTALEAVEADNADLRQDARESVSAPSVSRSRNTSGVEQWRPLVAKYFAAEYVDDALSVMRQESGGDPDAVNASSGCAGLFQQHPAYWAARSQAAGFGGASITDPEANIAVSAMLSNGGASWSHWTCKP